MRICIVIENCRTVISPRQLVEQVFAVGTVVGDVWQNLFGLAATYKSSFILAAEIAGVFSCQ